MLKPHPTELFLRRRARQLEESPRMETTYREGNRLPRTRKHRKGIPQNLNQANLRLQGHPDRELADLIRRNRRHSPFLHRKYRCQTSALLHQQRVRSRGHAHQNAQPGADGFRVKFNLRSQRL